MELAPVKGPEGPGQIHGVTRRPPPVRDKDRPPPKHPAPKPSAAARRAAVAASRTAARSTTTHAAVFQPWVTSVQQAEVRMRTEITEALRQLDGDMASAGQILDTAQAIAAADAGALQDAAWATWNKYMDLAAEVETRVLTPALAAYDKATQSAQDDFNRSLGAAVAGFQRAIAAADSAQAQAQAMPAV